MTKYYNQTQNDLKLFYDKMILLHFIIDELLFQIAKIKNKIRRNIMKYDLLKRFQRNIQRV
jgi:hypothetical protein